MDIRSIENGYLIAEAPGIILDEKAKEQLKTLSAGCDDEMDEMLSEAAPLAVPKAVFTVAEVLHTAPGSIKVNGIEVKSELMSKNFAGLSRAFPYICTVGAELERWSEKYSGDPLSEYWADEIKKAYLYAFIPSFRGAVADRYGIKGRFPSMNPGSLEKEWPISGQEQLFSMLGGREAIKRNIGVTLTDSFLMLPSKTVSGISFESEHDYENCMLCPRVSCPNRRAKYDPSLEK